MKQITAVLIAGAWLCAAVLAQADIPPAPQVPDEVLAIVEIAQPEAFEQQARAFVHAAGLDAPDGRINLDQVTRTTQWDRTRPLRVLVLKTEPGGAATAAVFGVQDADAFLNELAAKFARKETVDGITTFVDAQERFDYAAYSQAAQGGVLPDAAQFRKAVEVPILAAVEGGIACVGTEPAGVAAARKLLRDGRLTDQPLIGHVHYLEAYARPKTLLDCAGAGGELAQQQVADALRNMAGTASQVEGAFASVRISPERIVISMRLYAAADTPLAGYLRTVPQGAPQTLGELPAGCLAFSGFRTGDLTTMVPVLADAARSFCGAMGVGENLIDAQVKAIRELAGLVGNDFAFAATDGGWSMAGRLRDEEAAGQVRDKMNRTAQAANAMAAAAGVPIQIEVRTAADAHNGIEIDEYCGKANLTAIGAEEGPAGADALQNAVAMGPRLHCAVRGAAWLAATGREDSLPRLKAMLDGSRGRLTESQRYKDVMAALPPDPQGVVYVALSAVLKARYDAEYAALPPDAAQGVARIAAEPGPGLYGAMRAAGDRAALVMILPADEMRSVVRIGEGLVGLILLKRAQGTGAGAEGLIPGAGQ